MRRIHLFVPGHPAPQGSKKHIGHGIMIESSKHVGPWRDRIALAAHQFKTQQPILLPFDKQPLHAELTFVMLRPTTTAKTRTPPAIKRPDLDKLVRAVFDALTGIIFTDDAAITQLSTTKRLAEPLETPGVHISIKTLA